MEHGQIATLPSQHLAAQNNQNNLRLTLSQLLYPDAY